MFLPVGAADFVAAHLFGFLSDLGGEGDVVELHFDGVDGTGLAEDGLDVFEAGEAPSVVEIEEAAFKDADDAEFVIAGAGAEGGHVAVGADDGDDGIEQHAGAGGEAGAEEEAGVAGIQVETVERTLLEVFGNFGPFGSAGFCEALEDSALALQGAAIEHLAVEDGGDARDVGDGPEILGHGGPFFEADAGFLFEKGGVGGGAEEGALEGVAEAVGDGEGDDEGHDAGGNPEDGDAGDDGDDGVFTLGGEVAAGDEAFEGEAHSESRRSWAMPISPSGRRRGKRMTSRMERESVRIMVSRSMPMPSPPVGGMP